MKRMTMTAALLAVTLAQAADFAVPENWRLRKLAGRELYSCFHSGVWARDWEKAPDWPMMRNVYMMAAVEWKSYDVFGRHVSSGRFGPGLVRQSVPRSGYVELRAGEGN